MKTPRIFLTPFRFCALFFLATPTFALSVSSPDGKIVFELTNAPDLAFRVEANSEVVLEESPIRIYLDNDIVLGQEVKFGKMTRNEIDETWQPVVSGRRSSIRNFYNQLTIDVEENSLKGKGIVKDFRITVRVFNDGVAFRYSIPCYQGQKLGIIDESTYFRFPKDMSAGPKDWTCWVADYKSMISPQESQFVKQNITEISSDALIGLPLVVKVDSHYLAITEADLEDYAGMFLKTADNPAFYDTQSMVVTTLAKKNDQSFCVVSEENVTTPWRVVMIADNPSSLLQNDMLLNLNDPCAIEDSSWIEPGMMAWDHWWSGETKMDTETIKKYIELASKMGWKYQIIDWTWYGEPYRIDSDITSVNPALDMDEVRRFAAEKGVKLWLWLYWADAERDEAYLKAFELYESWGIAGIKIDFMNREDQWMVNWYQKIIKAAAKHHLMVDFHGAYKPTGWRRTYPNMIVREGVLGNEYSKWSQQVTPEHTCTILYTRNLLGEMDFTPGGFLNRTRDNIYNGSSTGNPTAVYGTRAHQLALFVVFESPITCVCDYPDHILNQPGADFLKRVPTVWDETLGLQGEIGEYGVVAKRSGQQWFVGAITNWDTRQIGLDLSFLPEGKYRVEMWEDGENANVDATALSTRTVEIHSSEKLPLNLASGGGVTAIFTLIE
jgi:alpha-glucosidase